MCWLKPRKTSILYLQLNDSTNPQCAEDEVEKLQQNEKQNEV